MKELEQSIRKHIEEAGLAELLPGFDTEAAWQEIDARLRPRSKRLQLRPVLPYAAILLAGLCTACLLYVLPGRQKQEKLTAMRSVRRPSAPLLKSPVPIAIPVPDSSPTPLMAAKPRKQGSRQPLGQQEALPSPDPATPLPVLQGDEPVSPLVLQQPPLRKVRHYLDEAEAEVPEAEHTGRVTAAQVPVRVKHFLDIDNENRGRMQPEPGSTAPMLSFRFKLNKPGKAGDNERPATPPIRAFIYSSIK